MLDAIRKWIGDAPVTIRWVRRGTYEGHAAYIRVEDGRLCLDLSVSERGPDGDFTTDIPNAFIAVHDIGHFLAASDDEVGLPNLGLASGPTHERRDWERQNEELTLAYQMVLFRMILGDDSQDSKVWNAARILGNVVGVRKAEIERLISTLTPVRVQAEWDRKMALVASMTLVGAGI